MREVSIPYIFMVWVMMGLAMVNWLLQLVVFIYHGDHMSNLTAMIIETLFFIYLFAQHVFFLMRKDSQKGNPHILIGLLLIQLCLFILQMWWLLIFIVLLVHSDFLGRLLTQRVEQLYHLSIKPKVL